MMENYLPKEKKIYYGVDLLKLLCAILIVYMHTYNNDWGIIGGWIKNALATACVPYFFIASGFFFRKGIDRHSSDSIGCYSYTKSYLLRLVKMYVAWSFVTIPISILIIQNSHPDYSFFMKALYELRLFFLTGSIGIYWYLLALILSVSVIVVAFMNNKMIHLGVLATFLFLLGCLYNSPFNHGERIYDIIHVVFGSERNFLNVGLFYVMIGFTWPSMDNLYFKNAFILLFIALVIRTCEIYLLRTNFTQCLVAMGAFLFSINCRFSIIAPISLAMRKLSLGIYLIHFPFILLFDFFLTKGTILDFLVTLLFAVVTSLFLRVIMNPRQLSVFFGD